MKLAIKNGKIITPDNIFEDKILVIEDDIILALLNEIDENNYDTVIDAKGRLIAPGIIDIHSDKIEQYMQPRPSAIIKNVLALKECERELMITGITTMYHSLSFVKSGFLGIVNHMRTMDMIEPLIKKINELHCKNHLIRHRFHLRLEIDFLEAIDTVKRYLKSREVHLISFMDHTPGQGQYRNMEIYRQTHDAYSDEPSITFEEHLIEQQNKKTITFDDLRELVILAKSNGISVASHDDDTIEKVNLNSSLGINICEFPINIDTAKYAKTKEMYTVVGAPNILLGGSHSGNMSAAQAVIENCADIICSDYYPPAILHSIFILNKLYNISFPELFLKVSLNPAKAVGIDKEYGSISVGKKADIIIIDELDEYPVITHCFVNGVLVSTIEYRR